jgi:hypothetical protein
MRMSMRRFTSPDERLLKKLENHAATVARYFMYYNSPNRRHQTLRVTSAMEAGLADHVRALAGIVALRS